MQQSEIGSEIEGDLAAVTAARFFAPVTADGPLALGPFTARSSRVTIAVDGNEQRQTIVSSIPIGSPLVFTPARERNGYTIGGRKIWRESGWFVGGSYEGGDTEFSAGIPGSAFVNEGEIEGYGIVAGKYLAETTSLELGVGTNDVTTSFPGSFVCSFVQCIIETTLTTDEAALSALHLKRGGALAYSISGAIVARESEISYREAPPPLSNPPPFFAGGVATPPPAGFIPIGGAISLPNVDLLPIDRHYVYSIDGELFPTRRLGVGLGYVRWDGEPLLDDGYNVNTTWFFHERVAVRFAYARTTRDTSDPDFREDDALAVTFLGRL